ncbi:MAG: hypothetical protein PVI26_03465 [Chitinispirillia bacterium]|jgi:hypothetical protein
MLDVRKVFRSKLLLLLFLTLSANAQKMRLSVKSSGETGEPVKVWVEASGLNGMRTVRCTLLVDTTVLQSSEAAIASGISNISVTGKFGKSADTVIISSTLIDSSHTISQENLAILSFPPLISLSNYSSAIRIIGGSIELKTGEIIKVNINSLAIRPAYNYWTRSRPYKSIFNTRSITGLFDVRGRNLGNSTSVFRSSCTGCLVDLTRRSGLSQQVLIGRNND